MPRTGIAAHRREAVADERQAGRSRFEREGWTEDLQSYSRTDGVPGRRTVTITGQGAEGYASRNGTRPSGAQRHQQVRRHERAGFRPDRVAMWAVLLGVMLMLAAAASSHAAVLVGHHVLVGLR
jgi:hypothetical protein